MQFLKRAFIIYLFSACLLSLSLLMGTSSLWQHLPISLHSATMRPLSAHADVPWDQQNVVYTPGNTGMNLPWLNLHNGSQVVNWLNTAYDAQKVEDDLSDLQAIGIQKIRAWAQMESIFNYKNSTFILNPTYAANLDDFLNRAERHGISVILVMGDGGNEPHAPQDLDGLFRWELIQNGSAGDMVYARAYAAYLNRFKFHPNILMWEIANEPYSNLSFYDRPQTLGITQTQVHAYLLAAYKALKPLAGTIPVGFSDYEEEQQTKYQLFSSAAKRAALVDDCTDIYSMHIYRLTASQVADFRTLTAKPKWATELGSYNYNDPTASDHPLPANGELFQTDANFNSFISISHKLLNSGFTLLMPWSWGDNPGMVKHNADGSHTLYKLPLFLKDQLLHNRTVR